jgi:hypothetical protein
MLQLYLLHDFYNIVFKIKHNIYITSGSAASNEKFWVRAYHVVISFTILLAMLHMLSLFLCCYVCSNKLNWLGHILRYILYVMLITKHLAPCSQ